MGNCKNCQKLKVDYCFNLLKKEHNGVKNKRINDYYFFKFTIVKITLLKNSATFRPRYYLLNFLDNLTSYISIITVQKSFINVLTLTLGKSVKKVIVIQRSIHCFTPLTV
ncbi:hypothetical protein BpHYR1_031948 [Brachionus plicatilis]|uniref:Uncharacterized protein n=1 Tax=Brachionus plicatilis TaxID=10195 RepID=A0A3M7T6G6_BRAPC|nr:hypothetical protein BpHYR1_031948 [Brachionus plicatilis]